MRPLGFLVLLCVSAIPAALPAQVPQVLVGDVACVPRNGHALVRAVAAPVGPADQVRVYFRRLAHGDFYWLPARLDDDGTFWAVLPLPEPDNNEAEIYGAVYGPTGLPLAQSRIQAVPVREDCRVELDPLQQEMSRQLVVGETALGQKLRKLAWWRCEGVRERIDVHGERRTDEACLPIVWYQRFPLLLPLAPLGTITVVVDPEPPLELSPVNP